jgi:hypothetical protein
MLPYSDPPLERTDSQDEAHDALVELWVRVGDFRAARCPWHQFSAAAVNDIMRLSRRLVALLAGANQEPTPLRLWNPDAPERGDAPTAWEPPAADGTWNGIPF